MNPKNVETTYQNMSVASQDRVIARVRLSGQQDFPIVGRTFSFIGGSEAFNTAMDCELLASKINSHWFKTLHKKNAMIFIPH